MVQQANSKEPREPALDVSLGPIKRFGRYTLIKKLATGGMAEIWLSRQTGVAGFNRFVVIKKILAHLAEERTFREMFLDEARMSAALNHPNIVQVYDLGNEGEDYFIAMEFILGENLAAIAWRGVKRQQPLSPVFAARIMADACKALHYAHHLRGPDGKPLEIVHRDISPQNILVTYEGEVKVVDFGIAKAASKSQHTKTGMLKGKFSYMSPEQCLGDPVDKRSDVFALGIVLYELCTGKRLFKHESELMILEMITKRRITPPSEVAENFPPELERIILKALEKDRANRFQTSQDFQIALEDFIRGQDAATSADIATYMRALFQDKIDEKRRLCELASREDFGSSQFEDEATERGGRGQAIGNINTGSRRRVVYGSVPPPGRAPGLPSSVHVNGVPRQASAPAVGTQTMHPMMPLGGAMTPHPGVPPPGQLAQRTAGQYQPALSGMMNGVPFASQSGALSNPIAGGTVTEERSWLPRLIILLALTVIVVAGTYLYQELTRDPLASARTPATTIPQQMGTIELDSMPSGATIYVNNRTVPLENGEMAKTPIAQLTNLVYGEHYELRLVKEGYEPWTQTVVMDETSDGKAVKASLKAIPGKVIVEVSGTVARDVRVFLDGKEQGLGPIIERTMSPGLVHVSAELADHVCEASPDKVDVPPGGAMRAVVRCERQRARQVRRPDRNDRSDRADRPLAENNRPPVKAPPPVQKDPTGCARLPDMPPGYVNMDTNPYSDIYLDGKRIGETPLSRQKLPAGCVELVAKSKETGKEKKFRITVEPNKTLRYRFEL